MRTLSRRRDLVDGDLTGTLLVNVLNLALGLITGVATARGLPPTERGELVALVVWATALGPLTLVGLDESIIFGARGSEPRAHGLRKGVKREAIFQSSVGTVALVLIGVLIVRPQTIDDGLVVALICLIVPLNSVNQLLMAPLRAAQRNGLWNLLRLIPQLVYAAGTVLLVLFHHLSVLTGIACLVAGVALTSLGCFMTRSVRRERVSADEANQVKHYGRRLVIATLPYQMAPRADQLLLGAFFPPHLLGVYAVATAVASVVQILGVSLEQILFPRWVADPSLRSRTMTLVWTVMAAAGAASVVIWVAAPWAVRVVYGNAYVDAVEPLTFLLIASVVRVGSSVLSAAVKSIGVLSVLTRANIVGLLTSVVAFAVLTPSLEMRGAAISSLLGAVTMFLTFLQGLRRVGADAVKTGSDL